MSLKMLFFLIILAFNLFQTSSLTPGGGCKSWQYRCKDGQCIDLFLLCDGGQADCKDGSDELKCGKKRNEASPIHFRCRSDGRILPAEERCDGYARCNDLSDEENCPISGQCRASQYRCNDGQCIPGIKVCDKKLDCRDGSDEIICQHLSVTGLCPAWKLCCADGTVLSSRSRCDKFVDCHQHEHASDESNCSLNKFPCKSPHAFNCGDNLCIDIHSRCNGYNDCRYSFQNRDNWNRDEMNCKAVELCNGEFTCDNAMCVPLSARCDGYNDCGDSSDELNCTKISQICGEHEFQCDSGRCVPKEARCDGLLHCADSSDEWGCGDLPAFCQEVLGSGDKVATSDVEQDCSESVVPLIVVNVIVLCMLIFSCLAVFEVGSINSCIKERKLQIWNNLPFFKSE